MNTFSGMHFFQHLEWPAECRNSFDTRSTGNVFCIIGRRRNISWVIEINMLSNLVRRVGVSRFFRSLLHSAWRVLSHLPIGVLISSTLYRHRCCFVLMLVSKLMFVGVSFNISHIAVEGSSLDMRALKAKVLSLYGSPYSIQIFLALSKSQSCCCSALHCQSLTSSLRPDHSYCSFLYRWSSMALNNLEPSLEHSVVKTLLTICGLLSVRTYDRITKGHPGDPEVCS